MALRQMARSAPPANFSRFCFSADAGGD